DQVSLDAPVSESNDSHTGFLDLAVTEAVRPLGLRRIMYVAIQLDGDTRFGTVEIGNVVGAEGMLAAEFQPVQTSSAKALPERILCLGGIPAQFAGEFQEDGVEASQGAMNVGVGRDLPPRPLSIGGRGDEHTEIR